MRSAEYDVAIQSEGTVNLEPANKHPTSNIEHPTSNIQHRTSNIEHPTSNIQHRTSNIEHPTSNIQHRTSLCLVAVDRWIAPLALGCSSLTSPGACICLAMVGMARCAVPARAVAGGTSIRATLAFQQVAPLHAAPTSRRDVPTTLNTHWGE